MPARYISAGIERNLMNHLEELTGTVSKQQICQMMSTGIADKYFKKGDPNDYNVVPREKYELYTIGGGIIQTHQLISEDNQKGVATTIYANYNVETKHFEPYIAFERFYWDDKINNWELDSQSEEKCAVDFRKRGCWKRLEKQMRKILDEYVPEVDYYVPPANKKYGLGFEIFHVYGIGYEGDMVQRIAEAYDCDKQCKKMPSFTACAEYGEELGMFKIIREDRLPKSLPRELHRHFWIDTPENRKSLGMSTV